MKIHPTGLIAALHEHLPALLPAHEVLGAPTAEFADDPSFAGRSRGDYVYVQGRGDRIHAFLCVGTEQEPRLLDAFARADANWRWVVAWDFDVTDAMRADAARLGLGVVAVPRQGPLATLVEAVPNPGIFIKGYRDLRARWRTLSSW